MVPTYIVKSTGSVSVDYTATMDLSEERYNYQLTSFKIYNYFINRKVTRNRSVRRKKFFLTLQKNKSKISL